MCFLRLRTVSVDLLSYFVEKHFPALRFSTRFLSHDGKSLKKARLADFTPVSREKTRDLALFLRQSADAPDSLS